MATTVWLMALGTAVIGLLPTYANIGIAAPVLLVFCRIAQGLALGGETTGTTSFILESAPDDHRGGWIGLTLIFSHLPNALVAGLLIGLQVAAGATAYADWVWRVPFLAGGLIGIVGFWLRRNLDEPDEYKQATRRTDSKNPLRTAIRAGGLRGMLNVAMIQPIQTVGSYLLLGFMYTFLVRVAKLDPTSALTHERSGHRRTVVHDSAWRRIKRPASGESASFLRSRMDRVSRPTLACIWPQPARSQARFSVSCCS